MICKGQRLIYGDKKMKDIYTTKEYLIKKKGAQSNAGLFDEGMYALWCIEKRETSDFDQWYKITKKEFDEYPGNETELLQTAVSKERHLCGRNTEEKDYHPMVSGYEYARIILIEDSVTDLAVNAEIPELDLRRFRTAEYKIELFMNYDGDVILYGKYCFHPGLSDYYLFGYVFNKFNVTDGQMKKMRANIKDAIINEKYVSVCRDWDRFNCAGFEVKLYDHEFKSITAWKLLRKKTAQAMTMKILDSIDEIYSGFSGNPFFDPDTAKRHRNIAEYGEKYRRAREEQIRNER